MDGNADYVKAFLVGYTGGQNEYLSSSNMSDAVELGRYWRAKNLPLPTYIKKSRGYTWIVNRTVLRVDGTVVTEV